MLCAKQCLCEYGREPVEWMGYGHPHMNPHVINIKLNAYLSQTTTGRTVETM